MLALEITGCEEKKYRAILVDFDGVLRQWPASDYLIEKKYGLVRDSIRVAAFEKELLDRAIRGIITDQNWRSKIADNLQVTQPDSDARSAIKEWSSNPGEIDTELLSVLSHCKSVSDIFLLTNATSRLYDDLASLGLENWFSDVINSSNTGSIKPEPEIYQEAIQACNCAVDEIVYIDDSLENTLAASQAGILSHHYNGVVGCRRFLVEIGVSGHS